jgi:peptide-methionine (S)-S-oxide reductase
MPPAGKIMKTHDIPDPAFQQAVQAIDDGDVTALQQLLQSQPSLVTRRLQTPDDQGYFKDPCLLWFIADNPIRHDKLPANIVQVASVIINALRQHKADHYQLQLDYTLGLVATGKIPKDCGVQIPLMAFLIDQGARVRGSVLGPIGQHNFEAARFLLAHGAQDNLPTAAGLGRVDDVKKMVVHASDEQLYVALVVAAFFGNLQMASLLLAAGANVNGKASREAFDGFHGHASPLHQAVSSQSLPTVQRLIEAGADLNALDTIYKSTPLAWAGHMHSAASSSEERQKFAAIQAYLIQISDA